MNERKVKKLRKLVYGDFSPREVKYTRDHDSSVRCEGRRAMYQKVKKEKHSQPNDNKHVYKGRNRPRWLFPGKGGATCNQHSQA